MVDKKLYNTVVSQTFSPCGNYLLAGNTYGDIAVYDLQHILSPGDENTPPVQTPMYHFSPCKDSQVCSAATTGGFLIVGTSGEIIGFDWDTVTALKKPALSWSMTIPANRDELDKPDVNSMAVKIEDEKLYAGCGDNKIYVFDLYGGKLIRTFEGHSDYIHCVQSHGNQLVSASEDGTARIWDLRQQQEAQVIKPHLESKLSRPALGKWLAAAAINSDWMVCGGGPYLSLWHLRSMSIAESYTNLDDNGIHVTMLHEDRVLAGGAAPYLNHISLSGNLLAQVPSSSTCLYSVVLQEKPNKVLCMAGSSSKIDICTNFNYRDQILSF